MVQSPELTRRNLLRASGVAVGTTLAGCTGGESTPSSDETNGTEAAHKDEEHHDTATGQHDDGGHDDGGHDDGHSEIGKPVEQATVKMIAKDGGYHFEPHIVRVKKGGTVTFVNESGDHSTTAYHPDNDKPLRIPDAAESWDSGLLSESGAEFERTFETEGIYDFFCTPHESVGMVGTVVVGKPDTHDQPGLEPPQESLAEETRTKITSLNERVTKALGNTHDE